MKYKLKKDLPFAEAGVEVKLVNEKRAIEYNGYQCDIYDLRNGWIEEVKPREWYIVNHTLSHRTVEDSVSHICKEKGCQVTKVREVIK